MMADYSPLSIYPCQLTESVLGNVKIFETSLECLDDKTPINIPEITSFKTYQLVVKLDADKKIFAIFNETLQGIPIVSEQSPYSLNCNVTYKKDAVEIKFEYVNKDLFFSDSSDVSISVGININGISLWILKNFKLQSLYSNESFIPQQLERPLVQASAPSVMSLDGKKELMRGMIEAKYRSISRLKQLYIETFGHSMQMKDVLSESFKEEEDFLRQFSEKNCPEGGSYVLTYGISDLNP